MRRPMESLMSITPQDERTAQLATLARDKILFLDGAMGTMIQTYKLTEAEYRGEQYKDWPCDLKGNNDLLCLTKPDVIREIHRDFLEAGADILMTNSFNGTSISMADYEMESEVWDINVAAATIARKEADAMTAKTPDKPRFVAGSIGPTNKTLSISPDVNNPGYRDIEWDDVVTAYQEQAEALITGGVDIILIETIFDTLNAKAAIFAVEEAMEKTGVRLPLFLSCTITDRSGRNLSGQTVEAFWHSVRHAKPFAVGLNCSFGAENLSPHATSIAAVADTLLCFYPNAGLPNDPGEYDEYPETTAAQLGSWAEEGIINIVGGCCGTTPAHIRAIQKAMDGHKPRPIPQMPPAMRLSGLEPLTIEPDI